jgi:hypothetical protein
MYIYLYTYIYTHIYVYKYIRIFLKYYIPFLEGICLTRFEGLDLRRSGHSPVESNDDDDDDDDEHGKGFDNLVHMSYAKHINPASEA